MKFTGRFESCIRNYTIPDFSAKVFYVSLGSIGVQKRNENKILFADFCQMEYAEVLDEYVKYDLKFFGVSFVNNLMH